MAVDAETIRNQYRDVEIGLGRPPILVNPRTLEHIEGAEAVDDALRDAPPAVLDAWWRQLGEAAQRGLDALRHHDNRDDTLPAAVSRPAITTETTMTTPAVDDRRHVADRYRNLTSRAIDELRTLHDTRTNTPIGSEVALAAAMRHAGDEQMKDLARQLDDAESRIVAREQRDARLAATATRQAPDPSAPPSPVELLDEARNESVARIVAFRNSDAGRLERLIELNEQILAALEAKQ